MENENEFEFNEKLDFLLALQFDLDLARINNEIGGIVDKYRLNNQTLGLSEQFWLSQEWITQLDLIDLPNKSE
jgi:hypothetical protein